MTNSTTESLQNLVPPSPPAHWLLGNLPEFKEDVLGFFLHCAREYGAITKISLATKPAYLLTDPELIAEPLLHNYKNFIKNRFFWRHVEPILGLGLLTSEGEFWRKQRRRAAPAFHQQKLAAYTQVMVDYTQALLDGWQDGDALEANHEMMAVTSRIAGRTLFDAEVGEDEERIGMAMDLFTTELSKRMVQPFRIPSWLPTPGNRRWKRAVKEIDDLVYRFIADHRKNPQRDTLLSMLMQAEDEDGKHMSDKQLHDESITLFVAGHETTALSLSWTWYLLSQNPQAEQALHEELDRVLGGKKPELEDIADLKYTSWVLKESMRIYPPAYMFGRQAVEACKIGQYEIPADATLYFSTWSMHRDTRWFDQPDKFLPERWDNDFEKSLPRFVYMPFGAGPRTCIGERFALMEAVLILASIAQKYRLIYTADQAPKPFPSITLRPAGGVPVRLEARC